MVLSDEKYIRVTTFKKDGTEVSTPTWVVALDDGKIGFYTSSTSGKAKRLKNNPNVVVQPSNGRGRAKPGTSPLTGTAVVVSGPEREAIYEKVVAKYGFMTKITRASWRRSVGSSSARSSSTPTAASWSRSRSDRGASTTAVEDRALTRSSTASTESRSYLIDGQRARCRASQATGASSPSPWHRRRL
jgi:PPOX class probable F420-dependent enzyme